MSQIQITISISLILLQLVQFSWAQQTNPLTILPVYLSSAVPAIVSHILPSPVSLTLSFLFSLRASVLSGCVPFRNANIPQPGTLFCPCQFSPFCLWNSAPVLFLGKALAYTLCWQKLTWPGLPATWWTWPFSRFCYWTAGSQGVEIFAVLISVSPVASTMCQEDINKWWITNTLPKSSLQ